MAVARDDHGTEAAIIGAGYPIAYIVISSSFGGTPLIIMSFVSFAVALVIFFVLEVSGVDVVKSLQVSKELCASSSAMPSKT